MTVRFFSARSSLVVLMLLAACDTGHFGLARPAEDAVADRLALLSNRLNKNPNDTKTLDAIGLETARLSQWDQSLGAYRESLIVEASNSQAQLGYARGLLAVGQYDHVFKHTDAVLAKDPKNLDALILKAGAFTGKRQYQQAEIVLNAARLLAPRDLDVRGNLALTRALAGHKTAYAEARAVAFAPDADIRHQRNLMLIAGLTGHSKSATRDGAALGLAPDTIKQLTALGKTSRGKGMSAFGLAPVA